MEAFEPNYSLALRRGNLVFTKSSLTCLFRPARFKLPAGRYGFFLAFKPAIWASA